ncbi:MAG: hypothetical protein AAFZ18_26355 [Myxococcota bacterium]
MNRISRRFSSSSTARWAWALTLSALWTTSCGDDDPSPPMAGSDAGAAPRFAVVRSDFETTAIALLDSAAEVTEPSFLSSGSQAPGLVAPLSGDVVLASGGGEPGVLMVIDRLGTDVLTRLDLSDGSVRGQLRVAPGDFSTNPQDLVSVDETRAWVSRFSVNLDASAPPMDQANDVIEINPSAMTATGRRVSLASFDAEVSVMRDEGPQNATAYARPSGLARVGSTLAVGLALLTVEFDGAARGQLALVDVDTASLTAFELPEPSRNCGSVQGVPGASDSVLVACSGFGRPFGNESQVRASAGVYRIRLTGAAPEVVWSWEPRSAPDPVAVYNVVALGPDRFLGIAYGTFGESGDEAFVIDVGEGEATSLFKAASAFALGEAAFETDSRQLVLPDASDGSAGLRLYTEEADGSFTAGAVRGFEDGPLPPRRVRSLPKGTSP